MEPQGTSDPEQGQSQTTSPLAGDEDHDRLRAYHYLTTQDCGLYVEIMRLFCASLLADLSAKEVAERLAEKRIEVTLDVAAEKLDYLEGKGNLLPSSHTIRVGSIAEYHRARSRYQVSKLGRRVQRQVDEVLSAAEGAREVSRELLAVLTRELGGLAARVVEGDLTVDEAQETVTTLFLQFEDFANSIRDFYAYVGQVLSRYDLDGAEYAGFKNLLLDYVESLLDEVARYTPRIQASLDRLWPRLPRLLALLEQGASWLRALEEADPTRGRIERSRGRNLDDWAALRAWFAGGEHGPSEVEQLRAATRQALQTLFTNAKRLIGASQRGVSRRRDLLRLAAWFDSGHPEQAHDLFVAAFGLYGARHLLVPGDEERPVPASESWWSAPAAEVPVSLRQLRGRAARGGTAAVQDHSRQKELLRRQAEAAAQRRVDAVAELDSVGDRLERARLSVAALRVLLDLLARALAAGTPALDGAHAIDLDLGIALAVTPTPGRRVLIRSSDGELCIDGVTLTVTRLGDGEHLTAGEWTA
ncbi:MAG TPA: TIGR02677 family protein [Actinomycetes bacterium]|jgi:uncharacterized protein (TIGR02677 family)|nr:TIGR02677 family protein [Actinomycetes bacterium]